MAKNDFKAFATASGANVSKQDDYEALQALLTGFQSGKASSAQVNKALRQATFIAAAVAQFVSDKSNQDVLDDGNLAGFGTKLIAALNQTSQPLDATLTALAALVGAANKLPYFNGAETAALTDLSQVGRDIIGKGDIAAVLQYLGLKTAALRDVGTGANQIPDMNSFQSGSNANGSWRRLPGGLLLQWGVLAASGPTGDITFPTPFTVQPSYSLSPTANGFVIVIATGASTTKINSVRTLDNNVALQTNGVSWIAIGV